MNKTNHCKKAYVCDGQNDECKFYNTNYFHLNECIHCKDNMYCTNEKAIKELDVDNDPEVRKQITNSYDAYRFCRDVENDPEVRKLITDSYDAYLFCMNVENDPEIRKLITDKELLDELS